MPVLTGGHLVPVNAQAEAKLYCQPYTPTGLILDPSEEETSSRIRSVAGPELVPRRSCLMEPLDHRAVIRRLLRSPMGMT